MSPWPDNNKGPTGLRITDAKYGVNVEVDGHELSYVGDVTHLGDPEGTRRLIVTYPEKR